MAPINILEIALFPMLLPEKRRDVLELLRDVVEDIHREQVVVDVDPELRVCPDCGEEMACIGHDVSEPM